MWMLLPECTTVLPHTSIQGRKLVPADSRVHGTLGWLRRCSLSQGTLASQVNASVFSLLGLSLLWCSAAELPEDRFVSWPGARYRECSHHVHLPWHDTPGESFVHPYFWEGDDWPFGVGEEQLNSVKAAWIFISNYSHNPKRRVTPLAWKETVRVDARAQDLLDVFKKVQYATIYQQHHGMACSLSSKST